MLGPHACFIVCVGCLTAECRQINPETSASTHKHKLERPRQDRGSTVPARLWELTQQQQRGVPPHLSVSVPPLSPALHLSVSHGRERKESMSTSFSICLAQEFSICSVRVVNPTRYY